MTAPCVRREKAALSSGCKTASSFGKQDTSFRVGGWWAAEILATAAAAEISQSWMLKRSMLPTGSVQAIASNASTLMAMRIMCFDVAVLSRLCGFLFEAFRQKRKAA
jgi:hypothetical protein